MILLEEFTDQTDESDRETFEGTAKESRLCTYGFSLKREATKSIVLVDDDSDDSELDRCPWAATGPATKLSISGQQTGKFPKVFSCL